MIAWLRCWLRERHEPVRHPVLPGWRCSDCGKAIADVGFVSITRPVFAREGYR